MRRCAVGVGGSLSRNELGGENVAQEFLWKPIDAASEAPGVGEIASYVKKSGIDPVSLRQNGYIEHFHSRFRDEYLIRDMPLNFIGSASRDRILKVGIQPDGIA